MLHKGHMSDTSPKSKATEFRQTQGREERGYTLSRVLTTRSAGMETLLGAGRVS